MAYSPSTPLLLYSMYVLVPELIVVVPTVRLLPPPLPLEASVMLPWPLVMVMLVPCVRVAMVRPPVDELPIRSWPSV